MPTKTLDAGSAKPVGDQPARNDGGDDATKTDAALGGLDASVPKARHIPLSQPGTITGPITGTGKPATASTIDLSKYGYVEQEYFIEGMANSYKSTGPRGLDGKWDAARNDQAHYKTRLLVRRPVDVSDFNGTALVEWLNVTGGIDVDIGFSFGWEEILRGGYAYVGVSVQQAGVGTAPLLPFPAIGPAPLAASDPQRYASLVHPGDLYAYDIFAQAGAAIGWPGAVSALPGFHVERVVAYGESQSAMRMITYVNAIHPLTDVYDAIFIHSRAGWGAAVGDESNALLGDGTPVQVRSDLDALVLQLFTESELFLSLGPAYAARQPDSDILRTWEVAGSAHADQRLLGGDVDVGCGGSINNGQQHLIVKSGFRALHHWLADGTAPPHGDPLEVTADHTDIARDSYGNALGGVRTPSVDAPISTLSGVAHGVSLDPICMLMGSTVPFTADQLHTLYPTHQDYVDKVTKAASDATAAGFVLAEDAKAVVATATTADVPP